ncbi:hypothetical protein TNCT_605961 [Trichonephila clavata]|uniref:Uncharacterized protein n=1 Tax=Trichonephila clavata TaxID=2740835 RepID=A0A8X6H7P7_TRICU|nr:hypothetical protein TNCT_605961 [Trichonephila clavata]
MLSGGESSVFCEAEAFENVLHGILSCNLALSERGDLLAIITNISLVDIIYERKESDNGDINMSVSLFQGKPLLNKMWKKG